MELEPKQPDEISLPASIGTSVLTLEEIGAVVCMACLENDVDLDAMAARLETREMQAAMKSLKARGVFSIAMEGSTVSMKINLGAIGL